ncbi:MAG: polyribonucleotide nucleotidyltransferase, polyribonucleotide nucleotidyltransferase [Candidatus Paceibacter sp.]|nr:polyribonucleotide nucleotidyltransferase, polyribonucleotide nucleotidyltransferase [Candidatus Paceibacter sp.]
MQKKTYSLEIGGKTLTAEFNDLVERANGSVMVKYGNTVVLATAVMSKKDKDGASFFPLTVEYEEKFYASGKILGSQFVRREGRPSDEAILSGRIVDRTIRPLFDQHIRREIQIVITILSIDEDDPDVLGVLAASLALGTSDIPFNGPVSAIRLGKAKDVSDFIINPTYIYRDHTDFELDLLACGKDGNINMIEVGSREVSNDMVVAGLTKAAEIGKKKIHLPKPEHLKEMKALFEKEISPKLLEHVFSNKPGYEDMMKIEDMWMEAFKEAFPDGDKSQAAQYFDEQVSDLVHEQAIKHGKRADGRGLDEVRPLYAQAGGISPMLHGSGIFYRGQTHVFSALTLGGPQDAQIIDGMETGGEISKRFMHHYNFPPFSVGETGRVGGLNRRMTGHGALAEKALVPVIPTKEKFPYTIRIVSETMTSNGSSSMASVCASTLALMDAGVPISAPVAGIASGLMMKSPKEYALLTDIQGPEDHHGDMDFKVAGTKKGITAIQMDVKVDGIPVKILGEALEKALAARLHILDTIEKTISAPRTDISPKAPKIVSIKINPDLIGLVIGPGGKTIKAIREKTGADIEIEDDGTVFITGKNGAAEATRDIIEGMTKEYKKGERFEGTVIKLAEFGAFVRIGPNAEGLVHISEIANFRVDNVAKYLSVGQIVPVIIKEIDEKKRINLSIKQANPDFIKQKVS